MPEILQPTMPVDSLPLIALENVILRTSPFWNASPAENHQLVESLRPLKGTMSEEVKRINVFIARNLQLPLTPTVPDQWHRLPVDRLEALINGNLLGHYMDPGDMDGDPAEVHGDAHEVLAAVAENDEITKEVLFTRLPMLLKETVEDERPRTLEVHHQQLPPEGEWVLSALEVSRTLTRHAFITLMANAVAPRAAAAEPQPEGAVSTAFHHAAMAGLIARAGAIIADNILYPMDD